MFPEIPANREAMAYFCAHQWTFLFHWRELWKTISVTIWVWNNMLNCVTGSLSAFKRDFSKVFNTTGKMDCYEKTWACKYAPAQFGEISRRGGIWKRVWKSFAFQQIFPSAFWCYTGFCENGGRVKYFWTFQHNNWTYKKTSPGGDPLHLSA